MSLDMLFSHCFQERTTSIFRAPERFLILQKYRPTSLSNTFYDRYYAWDYRVLKKFARHCSTGEEIPQKLVKSMQGARDMFAATDLQRQVFFSFSFSFFCLCGDTVVVST
ncbi:Mitochondrial intermediate peptidase, mitochondrial [Glycine soja]|uniref:Mitochondrial intermediate peptidase, mitochondrial n=1 Tax=Glycine soja TaxID=3848 RepID=A0A445LK22_GLYSO|nr:Mitochondrial intermediate peptidase, mitochondrial [Glycine soja]